VVIVALYLQTNDPAFLLVLAVVAFGVALTTTALFLDRRVKPYRRPTAVGGA
jgi:hypothetical protein